MRKLVLAMAAAGALVVAPGVQASTLGDSAIGAGRTAACLVGGGPFPPCTFPARAFSFFAIATPGDGAFGLYTHRTTAGTVVVARVTCIEVEGKAAAIGGTSFTSGGVMFPGPWTVQVVDTGPVGDLISPFTFDPDGLTKPCASLVAEAGYFPVVSGGIIVRDGTLAGP
jgi:hypothetical protein